MDQETADRYGRIVTALSQAGTPIPSNDVWIGAHALQHGVELVTADRHFEKIAGLPVLVLRQDGR